ncbi:MAG: hypothetical protein U9R08_06320 [Nanoarchaeota archaeon]|nr:hypothetical protein [Nanoarchaeota archaeon]
MIKEWNEGMGLSGMIRLSKEPEFESEFESEFEFEFEPKSKKDLKSKLVLTGPRFSKNLIDQYQWFNANIYSPKSVFYPCCNIDGSPANVFDNVIFSDIDDKAMSLMRKNGLVALTQDVELYDGKHDLVILLNSTGLAHSVGRFLQPGGYILANDWHGDASYFNSIPRYQSLGKIQYKPELRLCAEPEDDNSNTFSVFRRLTFSRTLLNIVTGGRVGLYENSGKKD